MNNLKKGDVVIIEYITSKSGEKISDHRTFIGIILKIENGKILLGHNFISMTPIDTTEIEENNIVSYKKTTPKEWN